MQEPHKKGIENRLERESCCACMETLRVEDRQNPKAAALADGRKGDFKAGGRGDLGIDDRQSSIAYGKP
jgi:hypothetical protein